MEHVKEDDTKEAAHPMHESKNTEFVEEPKVLEQPQVLEQPKILEQPKVAHQDTDINHQQQQHEQSTLEHAFLLLYFANAVNEEVARNGNLSQQQYKTDVEREGDGGTITLVNCQDPSDGSQNKCPEQIHPIH